jgi:hypothetical protein
MNFKQLSLAATLIAAGLGSVQAQQIFPTPEAAGRAFVDAVAINSDTDMRTVLGPNYRSLIPNGVDPDDKTAFLFQSSKGQRIVMEGANRALLAVGPSNWTLPIPIVKRGSGWQFDLAAAQDEFRTRRIGRNENSAVKAAVAYSEAQREYQSVDRNGDGVREYAQKFASTPGKRDGLYWSTAAREALSPLGGLFASADAGMPAKGAPWQGYRYRILAAQGSQAPGGAKSYLKDGKMTEGYALLAWPAKWGDTGVMSFMVGPDGVVYEKNLGSNTAAVAPGIKAFDPDASWTRLTIKP